ncbi:MAG: hypothetical protein ACE5LL_04400, partial [Alphaproteobacteria bacterium]
MALDIETFSNTTGPNSFFKAAGHPLVVDSVHALVREVAAAGPVAIYNPLGHAQDLAELYDLTGWDVAGVYVQRAEELGRTLLGEKVRAVTQLEGSNAACVFVAGFDAERAVAQIRRLVPDRARVVTLDSARLPDDMLSNRQRYLDGLNFATNFAFFRDAGGHHTAVVSANYWHAHGARGTALWLCLFDEDGQVLAQWREALPESAASFTIDSAEVRRRFGLGEFTGSLFIHALHVAGHDVLKYALDTYGDDERVLSSTHDANAWPAELYGGLPAPRPGERVLLWVQNSHPTPIPAGGVGLNLMGSPEVKWFDEEIPPFGTRAIDVGRLLPAAEWPGQIEVRAGKHFVRPRYEVVSDGGPCRIAHANVERTDLVPDPNIPELSGLMGKGFILPASVLPLEEWQSVVLPTPMTTCQEELPLQLLVYDASGAEVLRHRLGRVKRSDSVALDVGGLLEKAGKTLPSGYGHMELAYDFSEGGEADGWLHGLFRYEHKEDGHGADSSFGSHMYNLPITYKNEPQSYIGRPPGLSTRLFLRLGPPPSETLCHLIYPASGDWHPTSSTSLILHDARGNEVARREVAIPRSGSLLWRYTETFDETERARAGAGAYGMVRDVTCRLFGYQGLMKPSGAFSFDHMFG